jgi:hypothetical protein
VYCGVWRIKYRPGSKTNKSNCQFRKNSIYDWLVDNPSQDLFGQKPQYCNSSMFFRVVLLARGCSVLSVSCLKKKSDKPVENPEADPPM